MVKRIIDVSNKSYLYLKHSQLKVEQEGVIVAKVPVEDLGILILQHPAIVLSQALIIACQQNNVAVVFCDERHLPYSIILPIVDANSLHSKILSEQISLKLPAKKRLWQQIVKHKINQQVFTLQDLDIDGRQLHRLSGQVKSGDSTNIEAQAARKYWQLLFGNEFRRNPDLSGINSVLNYGYAIMRAMIARAIVGSGLHPALGLQHHNQYNGLNLADDLMEPFRPWVDRIAYRLNQSGGADINKETKQYLLGLLSHKVKWKQSTMPLMIATHYLTADIKRAFAEKNFRIEYPQLVAGKP